MTHARVGALAAARPCSCSRSRPSPPRIYASDEVQYFAYLRSLWFDRDVSFENEYRYFYDHG